MLRFQLKYAYTIIFTFTLTCFIIPFLIWITSCTLEFAFKITWSMFCYWLSFIFICYLIRWFNIGLLFFCFFWNIYFWEWDIKTFSIIIYTNSEWIILSSRKGLTIHGSSFKNRHFVQSDTLATCATGSLKLNNTITG